MWNSVMKVILWASLIDDNAVNDLYKVRSEGIPLLGIRQTDYSFSKSKDSVDNAKV